MPQISYNGSTLAGDAPLDVYNELRTTTRQATQTIEAVRASSVVVVPRGNRAVQVTFAIERTFTSVLDAEEFRHDHASDLPESGDLVYTLSDGSTTRTYADAVLDSVDPVQRGLCVVTTYSFLASEVS